MNKIIPMSVLLLALAASTAAAAGKGEIIVGGMTGSAMPTGTFGDHADAGFAGGAFIEYMPISKLGLGVDFMFHGPGGVADYINTFPSTVDDVTFEVLQFSAHGRWLFMPDRPVVPYVVGGAGVYHFTEKFHGSQISDNSDTKGGIFGGVGAEYKVTSMLRIGAEGTWHNIFTPGSGNAMLVVLGRLSLAFPLSVQ